MSRDKILAKLPRMSAACMRANGLTQPPAVDMSHDPHDVRTPKVDKPTLRQKRGPKLNKAEAALEAYLKARYDVEDWVLGSQNITLQLGNGVRYTPDFNAFARRGDMRPMFWEVKGFMRDDAGVKLKVAAALYPQFDFALVKKQGKTATGWRIEEVLP